MIPKLYLLSFLLVLASCTAFQPIADMPKLGEFDWKLISVLHRPVKYGDSAFLKFDETENKVIGKATCNSFTAEYQRAGQKISFTRVGSTKIYCEGYMDDENRIIAQLRKTTSYKIEANMLYLYAGGKLVLRYKR